MFKTYFFYYHTSKQLSQPGNTYQLLQSSIRIIVLALLLLPASAIMAQVDSEFSSKEKIKADTSITLQKIKIKEEKQNLIERLPERPNDTLDQEPFYYILKGDSLVREYIGLNEVILLKRLSFTDMAERRKYIILRRRTFKVYPYAKLAAERLNIMEDRLLNIKRKSQRNKYIKRVQKYIEGEFAETLKKFTRSEGRILVKLINRQTGRSTFDLVRDLRSGWRAFWYNQTAHWFDIELKSKYEPFVRKEDYYIEDILQRAFRDNLLEEQNSYNSIDILDLESFWSTVRK